MTNTIFYFFIYFVEAIILLQYSSNLFVNKCKPKVKYTVLCSLYLILLAASPINSTGLNAILYLFVNFVFLVTQYRLKWQLAFFHSAILLAVMSMSELGVYGIISRFAPHFWQNGNLDIRIIFAILNKTIFFIITYILTCLFKEPQKNNQQYNKPIFLLLVIPITSVFVMLTFISIGETTTFSLNLNWMIITSAILLLAINLLIFGINQYNQKKSLEYTEMQLMLQRESDSAKYYKMLSEQNENQSILIHDIKKHLQSIALLNNQHAHDKINAYIEQLMLSSDLKEISRLCDHEILNAILCRYQRQCEQQHISFHADIRSRTIHSLSDNDITSLFCNLLDNAFEAATHIPESFIEVTVGKRDNTSITLITIINSCQTNPFSGQNKNLTTHKPNKSEHGFGIKSIRKIVKRYSGNMEMYYNDNSSTFHTVIMLKF